jgi:tight adherence protein C
MLLVVGFGGILIAITVMALATKPDSSAGVNRSLELAQGISTATAPQELEDEPMAERLLKPLLHRGQDLAMSLSPNGTSARLRKLLDRAGNPKAWPVERVFAVKGSGLIVGPILTLMILGFDIVSVLIAIPVGAAFFMLPDLLLYNAGMKRAEETTRGLGDALDMLCVCVEAGQGFDAALVQVARSVKGPIAEEFARVISEIQIGKSRSEAFFGLSQRLRTPEVRNFVTALVQADRMGLPLAGVLREQTASMRLARRQLAEAKAQKVTVKILFPLLLCIFPIIFIIVLGPGAITLVDIFSNQ